MSQTCTHVKQIKFTTTDKDVCEDCIKTGDTWVHLRLCLECGHVGCCDSSKNKHATKHFHRTKHPIVQSFAKLDNPRRMKVMEYSGRDSGPVVNRHKLIILYSSRGAAVLGIKLSVSFYPHPCPLRN